ncbi:DUF2059 domain-containing protein [Algoriphagus namhaensis]
MKKPFLFLALLLFSTLGFAQNQPKEPVMQLMEVMMVSETMNQMIEVISKNPMFSSANIPDEFWEEFKKEFGSGELTQEIADVYSKFYTEKEILELIEFYSSSIGQKMLEVTPELSGETMQIGQKHGMKVMQKMQETLKSKGYTLPN